MNPLAQFTQNFFRLPFSARYLKFFLLALSLLCYGHGVAQSVENYKDGYVVLLNGDTLTGKVMDRDESTFGGLLRKIKFRPEKGWRKKYKPAEIRAYKRGDELFRTIWLSNENQFLKQYYYSEPGRGEQVFVKVIYSGSLDVYHQEWTDEDNSNIEFLPLIKKPGTTQLVRATQGIFGLKRKRLAEYFFECPALSTAILDKEISTVEELIQRYEQACAE
jgi:hypothetical protein